MALIDINWNPSRKELRVFSVLLIVFFAMVAWILHGRGYSDDTVTAVAAGGAVAGVTGLFFPALIRWVYVVWMTAVTPIGFIVSHIVLAIVFYGVVCPIGLIMRMTGRDPLRLKLDRAAKTYWNTRQQTTSPRRYFRQY